MLDLVICVYACDTIPKYENQLRKIEETWGAVAHKMENVKLLYFLGEEPGVHGAQFIHLHGVSNDYMSATYKQWHGLKYIYENYDAKFVMCCGTDTYINIPKLLSLLKGFDYTQNLYIGGHGCRRVINGNIVYFHSGGPGFVLSRECLKKIYEIGAVKYVNEFVAHWIEVAPQLIVACDVAMGYLAKIVQANTISLQGFYHCNYKGYPCHINQFKYDDIISCHLMTLQDFDDFTEILQKNDI